MFEFFVKDRSLMMSGGGGGGGEEKYVTKTKIYKLPPSRPYK